MKNFTALFIILLLFIGSSCQQNNFSESLIVDYINLDNHLGTNNLILAKHSEKELQAVEKLTLTKVQYTPLIDVIKEVIELSKKEQFYIDELRNLLISEAGNLFTAAAAREKNCPLLEGKPQDLLNKELPQQIFLTGYGNQNPAGPILQKKLLALRAAYLKVITDLWDNGGIKGTIFADTNKREAVLAELNAEISLNRAEQYQVPNRTTSWTEHTFNQIPIVAALPLLNKLKNDIQSSELTIIKFIAAQCGWMQMGGDRFSVIALSPKSYIPLGESYEADLLIGYYASNLLFSVSVNEKPLKIVYGEAQYIAKNTTIGEQKYTASLFFKNPNNGNIDTINKEFRYEVIP